MPSGGFLDVVRGGADGAGMAGTIVRAVREPALPRSSCLPANHPAGSVLPLVVVLMVLFLLMLAVVTDLGWIYLAKNQLQSAADAAALAGASQLPDEDFLTSIPDQSDDIAACRNFAQTFAGENTAAGRSILLDRNDENDPDGGIVVGYIDNPLNVSSPLLLEGVDNYNSVRVETTLSSALNGPLEMFLGAVTGVESVEVRTRATATIDDRIVGFAVNGDERLNMLPFSVDQDYWNESFQGYIDSSDPIRMYPNDLDAPGNFGSIDIGLSSNSTSDLINQILNGISASDIEEVGGLMLEDPDGDGIYTKFFQGDTGVSNSVASAFEDIRGQDRILPIHRSVINPGNNATFEVCGFVAVKIFDVNMTGPLHERHIKVLPRIIQSEHAIIDPSAPRSHFVYALALTR